MLAGAGGIEPPNGGIKIRCLTAWLRPNALLAHDLLRKPVTTSDQVRGQAFSGSCAPEEAAPKHEFARAARTIAAARRPINACTGPLYGISAAFSGLR